MFSEARGAVGPEKRQPAITGIAEENQTIARGPNIKLRGYESYFACCSSALRSGALRAALPTDEIDYSTRSLKMVGGKNEPDCLFETKNTVYMLMGPGRRARTDLNDTLSLY